MNKSIEFEISKSEFDNLTDIVRDNQGQAIYLFVDSDKNNKVVKVGLDVDYIHPIITFTIKG